MKKELLNAISCMIYFLLIFSIVAVNICLLSLVVYYTPDFLGFLGVKTEDAKGMVQILVGFVSVFCMLGSSFLILSRPFSMVVNFVDNGL